MGNDLDEIKWLRVNFGRSSIIQFKKIVSRVRYFMINTSFNGEKGEERFGSNHLNQYFPPFFRNLKRVEKLLNTDNLSH